MIYIKNSFDHARTWSTHTQKVMIRSCRYTCITCIQSWRVPISRSQPSLTLEPYSRSRPSSSRFLSKMARVRALCWCFSEDSSSVQAKTKSIRLSPSSKNRLRPYKWSKQHHNLITDTHRQYDDKTTEISLLNIHSSGNFHVASATTLHKMEECSSKCLQLQQNSCVFIVMANTESWHHLIQFKH